MGRVGGAARRSRWLRSALWEEADKAAPCAALAEEQGWRCRGETGIRSVLCALVWGRVVFGDRLVFCFCSCLSFARSSERARSTRRSA